MIKQVFQLPNGKTFENFDAAKVAGLDLLGNEIGEIIDKNVGTAMLKGNLTRQKMDIFDMLTTNNTKLVSLMNQYAELEAQQESDNA